MMFVVTLVALLIERFFDWSHLRNWQWYIIFQQMLKKKLPGAPPYLALAFAVLPLILVLMAIQFLIGGMLYGFVKLLFQLLIFLYCLGPRNFWADTFSSINILREGDHVALSEKLKISFQAHLDTQDLNQQFVGPVFVAANRRIFAVLFWYCILGIFGALLYRMISLSATDGTSQEKTPEFAKCAQVMMGFFDWIPIRLLTFIFALGGHFVQVFSCWGKKVGSGFSYHDAFVTECGMAALGVDQSKPLPANGVLENSAVYLFDRVLVITLIGIGLFNFLI